jgi:hypothetical protein
MRKAKSDQLALTDASASYLGYAYQGLYALLVLLDAGDDESVAVETRDDVLLSGNRETLHQLKHALKDPRPLTHRDEGWWKTMAIWAEHYRNTPGHYVFVTASPVALGDPLQELASTGSRLELRLSLAKEVARVEADRARATKRGASLPHQRRYRGIAAFRDLGPARQRDLLSRTTLHARAETIGDLPTMVGKRLQAAVLPEIRERVVERLIEWWDRRVLLALMGKRERFIPKAELQEQVAAIISQHRPYSLPDDYGPLEPPKEELDWKGTMVDQMRLVEAGDSRILRGLEAHWRATRQRERWLQEDISISGLLDEFDGRLARAWRDRHAPLKDDCKGRDDAHKVKCGRDLLDWSHLEAFKSVKPLRPEAPHDFLTQGTFQVLAQAKTVGWHPEYLELLRSLKRKRAS